MIIWCFSDNKNAISFYKGLSGIKIEEKIARIGDKDYLEYGFYFDLEQILKI